MRLLSERCFSRRPLRLGADVASVTAVRPLSLLAASADAGAGCDLGFCRRLLLEGFRRLGRCAAGTWRCCSLGMRSAGRS